MKTHITRNIIMEEETTMMMTTMITLTDAPEREDLGDLFDLIKNFIIFCSRFWLHQIYSLCLIIFLYPFISLFSYTLFLQLKKRNCNYSWCKKTIT